MTLLSKVIRRELPQMFDRRAWLVELHPGFVRFRAKRTRRTYDVPWDSIWGKAMFIAAEQRRLERRARRKK